MAIVLRSVDLEWPNGRSVFKNLNLSLESDRKYGLVGPNGSGKSTLAKLIRGELPPSGGAIQSHGSTCYFAQFENPPELRVSDFLAELWASVRPSDLSSVESLMAGLDFESSCATLSGGEWTRVRLLKLLASGADFLILDEPTNNLDRDGRAGILNFVRATSRGVLLISHDRELLGEVESILELSNQGLSVYGGNWSFYERGRELERARLRGNLEFAQDQKAKAQREEARKLAAQEKRMRTGKKSVEKLGLPKILSGARKRAAERTLGKLQNAAQEELQDRFEGARAAFAALKTDQVIYADFPETAVPAAKLIFEASELNFRFDGAKHDLWNENINFSTRGGARTSIVGGNGSGKTTFLKLLTGSSELAGSVSGTLKMGQLESAWIDQELKLLDPGKTVFDNVFGSSKKSIVEIRNLLAQFLFPGKRADQIVSTLSGGERMRAALAKIMISDPTPQLLILDEPTNNVDIANLEFLESALSKFEGAMIVVSHDAKFLENIGVTHELRLGSCLL